MRRNKIVFFGTPKEAALIAEALLSSGLELAAVVTAFDKPKGRKKVFTKSPVKIWAENHNIPVFSPGNLKEITASLLKLDIDLGVVAAFGKIIPPEILYLPKKGFINVHPSLLPRWRGPSPVQTALLWGEEKTGLTVHITREKVDAGEILFQKEIFIEKEDNLTTLSGKLFALGAEILPKIINGYLSGKISPKAQDESLATYSKIIRTEDGKINWGSAAEKIRNQIRALNPEPGTFAFWEKRRLIISEAETLPESQKEKPGLVLKSDEGLKVAAGSGYIIAKKIRPEGKKEMSGADFIKGNGHIIGAVLS